MMTEDDLERELRIGLTRQAERVPLRTPEWTGPTYVATTNSRRRLPAAGLLAAAAAIVGGVLLTTANRSTHAFTPSGTEFPTTRVIPIPDRDAIVRPDTVAAIAVPGHPRFVVDTRVQADFVAGTAVEFQCEWEDGSGGCAPVGSGILNIGVTSSVDNGVAQNNLWTWSNVPASAAYVQYTDGGTTYWQRPIGGFVAFPDVEGSDEQVVVFDKEGTVIARYNQAIADASANAYAATHPPLGPANARLNRDAEHAAVDSAMRACLTRAGATIPASNIPVMPAGADVGSIWSGCVAEAKAAVAALPQRG